MTAWIEPSPPPACHYSLLTCANCLTPAKQRSGSRDHTLRAVLARCIARHLRLRFGKPLRRRSLLMCFFSWKRPPLPARIAEGNVILSAAKDRLRHAPETGAYL